jgi:hypothetical protein
MEEVEIIRCEIQCEIYEKQIKVLIEHLLKIDEANTKLENELEPKVKVQDRRAA